MKKGLISVIGSCRVYTPLNKITDSCPFQLNHGQTEWFTHSTRDVIQKIKIVNTDIALPDSFIPLVINDNKKYNPGTHKENFYKGTDCYIIEISSIQTNRYAEFELQQWCLRDLKLNPEGNEHIISNLMSTHMTEDEILKDLETIYNLLGKSPILFVSHNMLPKPDGTLPKPRPIIKRALEIFSTQNQDVLFFDPSPTILAYGVDRAMKDPAHYTKEFEPVIGQAIIDKLLTFDVFKDLKR